jgi:hypothetical protein
MSMSYLQNLPISIINELFYMTIRASKHCSDPGKLPYMKLTFQVVSLVYTQILFLACFRRLNRLTSSNDLTIYPRLTKG